MDGKLRIAGVAQGTNLSSQVLFCPREREPLDQFGGGERLFCGPQAYEMPAVYLEISGMAGRVLGIEFLKSFAERLQIVREPIPQGATLLGFCQDHA
jgi:hypothetical protein